MAGRKMSQLSLDYAINGIYFDTPRPHLKESIWQMAIQDGVALGQIAIKALKKVLWCALQMVESSWIALMTWTRLKN